MTEVLEENARRPIDDSVAPIHALIPAHNESDEIGATLQALSAQVPVNRITVVCDNCTDDTEQIAAAHGAATLVTRDNSDKKAGALNQAMAALLDQLPEDALVLVLDADTVMNPDFVAVARTTLLGDPGLGAVGGIFNGRSPEGLLQHCQANEYARYAREVERSRRVMVLTGTAALIRASALREVRKARGTSVPGIPGDVYDRSALTEDMELTLALLSLGWSLASPEQCTTITQLMPTKSALHQQRLRWYRGAMDNLRTYGWTRITRRYFFQQFMLLIGSLAMMLYLLLMVADAVLGLIALNWFWLAIGVLFALERVVTAWSAGVKGRLIAAVLLIELWYDGQLQYAFLRAGVQFLRGAERQWHHNTA